MREGGGLPSPPPRAPVQGGRLVVSPPQMVTLRLLLIAGMVAVTSAGVLEEALKGASCKVKELAADAKLNDDKFIDDMMDCMLRY